MTGAGTVANAVLIGVFVELLLRAGAIHDLAKAGVGARAGLLVGGIALMGLATAVYIGAGMGAGDSLMLVLTRRTRRRAGVVRTVLEATVTVIGFALGGTVGIGTLAFALGIGAAVEASFALLGRSPFVVSAEPQLVREEVPPSATDAAGRSTSCVRV